MVRRAGCLAEVSEASDDSAAASGTTVLEILGLSTAWPPGGKRQKKIRKTVKSGKLTDLL